MTDIDENVMAQAQAQAASIPNPLKRYKATRPLNPREEIFVREYSVTGDPSKSIVAAGYTGRHASVMGNKWLKRPRIQKKLADMARADEIKVDLTRDLYLNMLKDTYNRAMGDGDYAGANKAAELLGKALGYFVEQKAVLNVSSRIPEDQAARITEIQRLAKIAGVKLD